MKRTEGEGGRRTGKEEQDRIQRKEIRHLRELLMACIERGRSEGGKKSQAKAKGEGATHH